MSTNLERDIGKILQKLENIEAWMKDHGAADKEVEKRVSDIEKRNAYYTGAITIIVFIITATSDIFLKLIGLKV